MYYLKTDYDESKDELIGCQFENYRVIRRDVSNVSYTRRYVVKCEVCEKDPELYGEGLFTVSRGPLLALSKCCGCNPGYKKNNRHREILVKRKLKDTSFEFVSISGVKSNDIKVILFCNIHQEYFSTYYSNMMGRGISGCSKCLGQITSDRARKSDDDFLKKLKNSPLTRDDISYKRVENVWYYNCPICATDIYTKSGLCTGWFKTCIGSLMNGMTPCRCSVHARLTTDQKFVQTKSRLIEENSDLELLEVVQTKQQWKFVIKCPEHGVSTINSVSFKRGTRCPNCSKTGFKRYKKAYLYLMTAEKDCETFIIYGISNDVKRRLENHKSSFNKYDVDVSNIRVFEGKGGDILDLERKFKNTYKIHANNIPGFITESTELYNLKLILDDLSSKLFLEIDTSGLGF